MIAPTHAVFADHDEDTTVGAGSFAIVPDNLAIGEPPDLPTLARGSALLIFAFAGIEAALVPSAEIKDARDHQHIRASGYSREHLDARAVRHVLPCDIGRITPC